MNLISENRFNDLVNKFTTIDPILVLGDVGVDKYTLGDVKRISPEAPVPILEVQKEWDKLGLAANVADNLIGLGIKSNLCGVIGDDNNGRVFEELLAKSGLSASALVRAKDRKTTYKERVLTNTQQICRIDYETLADISNDTKAEIFKKVDSYLNNHKAIIIQDYGKGMITKNLCEIVIKKFKDAGKIVLVDPYRTTPPEFYTNATLLKPNKLEALQLIDSLGYKGEKNIATIAKILIEKLKLEQIIITLGAEGMGLIDLKAGGKYEVIPTVASEVFDVSGAGDTAASTIVASLVAGASLVEAAWVGNCASGVAVGKKGTARVYIDELKQFYQRSIIKLK